MERPEKGRRGNDKLLEIFQLLSLVYSLKM